MCNSNFNTAFGLGGPRSANPQPLYLIERIDFAVLQGKTSILGADQDVQLSCTSWNLSGA